MKYGKISSVVLSCLILSACGGSSGGSGGSSSGGGGGGTVSTETVLIDAMTTVPVMNGSSTKGTLYIHNYSNTTANNFSFNLSNATTMSKFKSALTSLGIHLNGAVSNNAGFTLVNPELCASIPAGGYCAINFTTPNLTVGGQGNTLVSLNYTLNGHSATAVQVVNYQYRDVTSLNGVNFSGSLTVSGAQSETRHVVGYLYGAGAAGSNYNNVSLSSSSTATTVSNGFINGQQVVSGQVIPVEFAVGLQNDTTTAVNITPHWGSTVSTNKFKLNAGGTSVGSGSSLGLTLTTLSAAHLIFGDAPILTAPTTSAAIINVTNNGNASFPAGLTATASGGEASELTITNNCASTVLTANATNSCTVTLATSSYIPGSTTVTFTDSSGTVQGSQVIYWTNSTPVPMVYATNNNSSIIFGKGTTQATGSVVFSVFNIGNAPLTNVVYTPVNTGPATWTQDTNSCGTTLAPASSCSINGHFVGTDDGYGTFYYRIAGSFNSVNYSFLSRTVSYQISANPSLVITPTNVNMSIVADGTTTSTQTFVVSNNGNDNALFTGLNLVESNTSVSPAITGGSCASGTTLAQAESCSVVVTYGPAANTITTSESGIAEININYHGGTPDTSYNAQQSFDYSLQANDSYVLLSTPVAVGLTGSGVESDPFVGTAAASPMTISVDYVNGSTSYPMTNFNVNTNNLPYGVTLNGATTCSTGSTTGSLGVNGSCTLVFNIDRGLLESGPSGGSAVLNFTAPTASWTTTLGSYEQAGTSTIYINYLQPTVAFVLSNNNGYFESTTLSMTASNAGAGSTLHANVSAVSNWLGTTPLALSNNCTVNGDTSVNCDLKTSSLGSVAYFMPTQIESNDTATIPLVFSTNAGEYAYLNPNYTFISFTNVTSSGVLSIFAGNGTAGTPVAGPAISSPLAVAKGVAVDSLGNVYIADLMNYVVEKISPAGILSVFAGNGTQGTPVSGTAINSPLGSLNGVAVDSSGNVYIADITNNVIEKVTSTGVLSIFAGNGTAGTPVAGPAISSPLNSPQGVAVDSSGNVYIADNGNNVIEKVTAAGALSIFAGNGTQSTPIAGAATSSPLSSPAGIAADSSGNVYIADAGNNVVEKVSPSGVLSIFAGNGTQSAPIAGPATSSPLSSPQGVAVDSSGNVYIADYNNNLVEKVTAAGVLSIFAGNGITGAPIAGPATDSPIKPFGVAVGSGNVYIADGPYVVKVMQ